MLITNQPPVGEHRHNYVRLAFLVGTLLLFAGYVTVCEVYERGYNSMSSNGTLRPEDILPNEITPAGWAYRCLTALNYMWQFAWIFYALTFTYRRSSGGYLYLSPNTLTPTFYAVYVLGFVIPAVWILAFQKHHIIWTWIVYLISFILLSLALSILNNNLAINKKLYETEGFNRDIWFLRFFAQNGVAFFACWTAIRFVLAFDTFLQVRVGLSMANAGTIALIMAGLIAAAFFFGTNFNAGLVEKCAYQFAPWIVFIIFFWGVLENNWVPKNARRNNIIAAVELGAVVISAIGALALFSMRYRASKIDPIA